MPSGGVNSTSIAGARLFQYTPWSGSGRKARYSFPSPVLSSFRSASALSFA